MYQTYNPQPQNPYIDRFAQNQQINQVQNQPVQQTQILNGKIVNDFNAITANDVPMDNIGAFFIKSDGSEIQRRVWASTGGISTISFKPVLEEQTNNLQQEKEKLKIELSDEISETFMNKFDEITEQLKKIEKNFGKTTKTKKEVNAE